MQTFRGAEDVSLQPNGEVCFFLVSVSDSKKGEIKGRFAKSTKGYAIIFVYMGKCSVCILSVKRGNKIMCSV